jgi:hypothetical protein
MAGQEAVAMTGYGIETRPMSAIRPLSGANRTLSGHRRRADSDPQRS